MKICILILSSADLPVYTTMKNLWRSYLDYFIQKNSTGHSLDYYFLESDPSLVNSCEVRDHDFVTRQAETYIPGITNKTITALKYFTSPEFSYDYIFRTNLSSFLVLDRFLQHIETLPRGNVYTGVVYDWHGVRPPIRYVSGAGFLMSQDVARVCSEMPSSQFHRVIDDVLIGDYLKTRNIHPQECPIRRLDFAFYVKYVIEYPEDVFHFRVKNHDRNQDIEILKNLIKHYYPGL